MQRSEFPKIVKKQLEVVEGNRELDFTLLELAKLTKILQHFYIYNDENYNDDLRPSVFERIKVELSKLGERKEVLTPAEIKALLIILN